MQIEVQLKQQYGQEVVVPICIAAKLFAQVAGTKTLTRPTIELVKQLGYRVVVAPTEPKEL